MAIRVRVLTDGERQSLENLTRSRTAPVGLVERAKIVSLSSEGQNAPAIAERVGVHVETVRFWLKRFNAAGLSGLEERPRPGRPPTYTSEERSEVVAAALTNPQELDLPFGCWTLDRLQAYLNEHKEIGIKRSRISEILIDEGLRWREQETWFSEKAALETAQPEARKKAASSRPVDPEFAAKRGRSNACTSPRPKGVR